MMQQKICTQNDEWVCDFCGKSSLERENGEKNVAWRCTADFRNTKGKTIQNGCAYDICPGCIEEHRVGFKVRKNVVISLLLEKASQVYEGQTQCSKENRVRKFL